MPIRMDLSQAKDGFDLIEPGTYEAFLFNVETTTSKSNRPMLKVTNKLVDSGRLVFDYIMLDDPEKNAWKLKQLCVAAGIPDERLGAEAEIDEQELIGNRVVITVVVTQPKEGSEYGPSNNVRKYIHPDAALATSGSNQSSGNVGW